MSAKLVLQAKPMGSVRALVPGFAVVLLFVSLCSAVTAGTRVQDPEVEFGPVVRAYLGYLKSEQEVVDDRVSRREVNQAYYRRNSNRIRALREIAIRLAKETQNDYLPELEAVARDEFSLLFQRPPRPESLRVGEVFQNTFRFVGAVRSHEIFYVFARLDPYEQAELAERSLQKSARDEMFVPTAVQVGKTSTRPRRASP